MSRVSSRSARGVPCAVAASPAVAGFRPAAACLAIALAFALEPALAQQAVLGGVSTQQQGSTFIVNTLNGAGTSRSVINWQSFSVPAGTITDFRQPSAASTSINRVLGGVRSDIFGTLQSNGHLVLVNPSGIAIGAGARVDTAGFTASTLNMSEADAIAGRMLFSGGSTALTVGEGAQILARGGDVVLVGSQVQVARNAVVQANGATILAAGEKVEITGRGLEGIQLEVQAGNEAVNLGSLQGDAVGIFAGTLKHSGLIQAQAVTREGGKVVLKAIGGDNLVDGTVVASAADGKGGSIDVLGRRVGLLAGANIDASGAAGGGSVRIGGDYQGRNADVPNADRTYVDANASIRADATQQGDGGRVIVWGNELTRMQGRISARGGAQGGDGGFAEVSGHTLDFSGRVDLRALQGKVGTLLLDPTDIVIDATTPTSAAPSPAGFDGGGSSPSYLNVADLEAALASSSVVVTTNNTPPPAATPAPAPAGNISVLGDISWSNSNTLGLQASGSIDLQGNISATDPGAALSMQALGGGITQSATTGISVANVKVNASGSVDLSGTNAVSRLSGNSNLFGSANGDFTFRNTGNLTLAAVGTPYGGTFSGVTAGTGSVDIRTVGGDLTVAASPTAADGVVGNNVTLMADGNVTLQGHVTATNLASLSAASGNISQSGASVVTSGQLALDAATGSVSLPGANLVDSLAGRSSTGFVFNNAQPLSITGMYDAVGNFYGGVNGSSGAVDIRTSAGSLTLTSAATVSGDAVTLKSTGSNSDVVLLGNVGASGSVLIDAARDAQVEGGSVSTSSDLTVNAGRNVLIGTAASDNALNLVGNSALTINATGDIVIGTRPGIDGTPLVQLSTSGPLSIVSTGGDVTFGSDPVSVPGAAYVDITSNGSATIRADAGSITFNNATAVYSQGAMTVYAKNDIVGDGAFSTPGTSDPATTNGSISMTAETGSLGFGSINTSGQIYPEVGNTYQAGNVTLQAAGQISGGGVFANGGVQANSPADVGGSAGTVTITSENAGISIGTVSASHGSAAGGMAGSVTLRANAASGGAGDIQVQSLYLNGGSGASGTDGGTATINAANGNVYLQYVGAYGGYASGTSNEAGGNGGKVFVTASGDINLYSISADGGGSTSGVGGTGGEIHLSFGGNLIGWPTTTAPYPFYLSAYGGWGGTDVTSGNGQTGGRGGLIDVVRTAGPLLVDSTWNVDVTGGDGGPADMATTTPLGGAGGNGGDIKLTALSGSVQLASPNLYAGGGYGGVNADDTSYALTGAIGTLRPVGTTVDVTSDLDLTADWINTSLVNIGGAVAVTGLGMFHNNGTVLMSGTAQLNPQLGVANAGTLATSGDNLVNLTSNSSTGTVSVAAASTLTAPLFAANDGTLQVDGTLQTGASGDAFANDATGLIAGSGTMVVGAGTGTLQNFGTIAPGGVGTIGMLTLSGNLAMEPGSTLAADILNTGSYDTLKVSGTATTAGAVAANFLPGASVVPGNTFRVLQTDVATGTLDPTTLPTVNEPQLVAQASGKDLVLAANAAYPSPPPAPPPPAAPDQVAAAQQSNNQVVTFADLFVQMAEQQQQEDKKDTAFGKDDIVVTDTACTR